LPVGIEHQIGGLDVAVDQATLTKADIFHIP
jgi:hypothetical protein